MGGSVTTLRGLHGSVRAGMAVLLVCWSVDVNFAQTKICSKVGGKPIAEPLKEDFRGIDRGVQH
jgi:peroxiredoxin